MNISEMIRAERLGDKTLARRAKEAGCPVTNITIGRWREDDKLPLAKRKAWLSKEVMFGLAAAVGTHPAVIWAGWLEGQELVPRGFSEGIRACIKMMEEDPTGAEAGPTLVGPEVGTPDQLDRTAQQVAEIVYGQMRTVSQRTHSRGLPEFRAPTVLPGLCPDS